MLHRLRGKEIFRHLKHFNSRNDPVLHRHSYVSLSSQTSSQLTRNGKSIKSLSSMPGEEEKVVIEKLKLPKENGAVS